MSTFAKKSSSVSRWILLARTAALILFVGGFSETVLAQVGVTISPASGTVATNEVAVFTATISGTTNTAVTWHVNNVQGGNATSGVISTTELSTANEALYLAPATVPSPITVTVTVTSQADTTKSASASVTIQSPSRSGVNWYVSTSGNDTHAGTLSAPFRTVQHAANTAVAGDTVQIEGGVYNEIVIVPNSGNATTGYITFMSYPGQTAILDGTGLVPAGSPYGYTGASNLEGLINLGTNSYIILQGLEVRNFTTNTAVYAAGINIEGAASYVQVLNNHVHNIVAPGSSCNSTNALGIAVYGVQAPASHNHITISGNEVDHTTTGCSENIVMNGNVQFFAETNNYVHDVDNICLDNIGFEGKSPQVAYDQARDGWVFQNTLVGCSTTTNPVYKNKVSSDAIYCDGCTRMIYERNLIHDADLGIELASEHSGHVGSYVVARNNVIYHALYVGISLGGYSNRVGSTDHCYFVNNTLWHDGTFGSSGTGESLIQYNPTNNFEYNNIMDNHTINKYLVANFASASPTPPVFDYNLYWSTNGAPSSTWSWSKAGITGFTNWQSTSRNDAHGNFADPQFVNISTTPPNLDVQSTSPAVNAGVNLGPDLVGVVDFAGNPRVNANGQINIGAYQQ